MSHPEALGYLKAFRWEVEHTRVAEMGKQEVRGLSCINSYPVGVVTPLLRQFYYQSCPFLYLYR